jgi:hypothetical protein
MLKLLNRQAELTGVDAPAKLDVHTDAPAETINVVNVMLPPVPGPTLSALPVIDVEVESYDAPPADALGGLAGDLGAGRRVVAAGHKSAPEGPGTALAASWRDCSAETTRLGDDTRRCPH